MTFPIQLETERLLLRWPGESDAEAMFARYTHDPVVARYMLWSPHESAAGTREWIRSRVPDRDAGTAFNWLILRKSDGELLGSIGCSVDKHLVQFGYCLAQDAWGQGYATEAARKMVPVWLATEPIRRVQALCDLENAASARVLEKAGLTLEGTLRQYKVNPNIEIEPRDVYMFAVARSA